MRQACSGPFADLECGFTGYAVGGAGFIERLKLDSYQARGVLTFLVQGAGHHVLKGVDSSWSSYEHTKAYTGRPPGSTWMGTARRTGWTR